MKFSLFCHNAAKEYHVLPQKARYFTIRLILIDILYTLFRPIILSPESKCGGMHRRLQLKPLFRIGTGIHNHI
jgi:hypothetical protein